MIVGCVKACSEGEKAKLGAVMAPEDVLLFFEDYEALAQSEYLEEIEVLMGEPPVLLLNQMKGLRWLQMTWAGVDMYMKSQEFPENVVLTNASGAFGKVISEYILAGLLALNRKMFDYHSQMQQGGWKLIAGERTLEGRTALILGAGDIGCETARKLKAFDVTVWGIRRTKRRMPDGFDAMYSLEELDALLPQADIVIACLPGTAETKGILTREKLLKMKKDAVLVNVGRGSLIPEKDLLAVLAEGHLGSVLLDVLENEPCPDDHPLRQYERVLLTPHISGVSWGEIAETRCKIIDIFCQNLMLYRQGKPLINRVDLKLGYRV